MKFFSLTAILGFAAVAFISQTEARNPLTAAVLADVRDMEVQVHGLQDSFNAYLAGDCAQTEVAYTAMANLIHSIESTMATIKGDHGKGLAGEDVAMIGQVLDLTVVTVNEIISSLIANKQRLAASGAIWLVQKALPILQKEYEAFKLVLLAATPLNRRYQIENPITGIVNAITRGVVAFQGDSCSCYRPNGGANIAKYGVGIQIIIKVAISIKIDFDVPKPNNRRDLPYPVLALPSN